MLTIYHNSRCAKSRAGLKYIIDNNIEYCQVNYLKGGLTTAEVNDFVLKTGLPVAELVRKQEDFFKKNLKGKSFSDEEWYEIIANNPKLLHRPIVVSGNKAVLAQPPENIKELL